MMMKRTLAVVVMLAVLGGCATPPPAGPAVDAGDGLAWEAVPLPGKRQTLYAWTSKDGRPAWAAQADGSASMWRRRLDVPPAELGDVRFSWWVPAPLAGVELDTAGLDDAPARVLFAFAGDHARLPARDRLLFDMAESLTGERPPYATLMYVFGPEGAEPDALITHPRSSRVRKIVVDAGARHAGQWREHRRDLAADFRRAFGEAPGALESVAVMTDGDNTRQAASAWYGPIELLP